MEKLSAGIKAAGPLTPIKLNPSGFGLVAIFR